MVDDAVRSAIKRERDACCRIVQSTGKMYPDAAEIKQVLITLYQEMMLRVEPNESNINGWIDSSLDDDTAQDMIL